MDNNDFLVLLQAKLDEAKSKGLINADINKIQLQLDKLKIQAEINPKSISNIVSQLEKILNQKININNINVDTNSAQKAGQNYMEQFNQGALQELSKSKNAIESFKNSLSNAGKNSLEIDSIIDKIKLLNVQIDSLRFSESTNGFMNIDISGLDEFKNKVKITQSLVQDLETMNWNVTNTTTSILSTKEIDKINNVFADYTKKLEQFKSTNNNILSGLSAPLSDFENKLVGLKNGSASINDVKNSFSLLNAEASKITSNLSGELNKVDKAVRNISKGEEIISGLTAQFKGLSNVPKEINSELNKLSIGLQNIKSIEAQEGRTANWSAAYKEWERSIDSVKAKLSTLKKEQTNAASTQIFDVKDLQAQEKLYIQKVNNTIAKTKSLLESKLRKLGYVDIKITGIEDAKGKVEALTASVTDATGAFKKLNFERVNIKDAGKGKVQAGFLQTDEVKVVGHISSSIQQVQNNLLLLKSNWEEQGLLVGEFKSKVEQLEASLASVGSKGELENLKTQIKDLRNEASLIAQANKIQLTIDTGGYESKVESLIAKTQQWTDEFGNTRISTDTLSDALKNLNNASIALSNNNTLENQKALINAEKELNTQIQTVTNSVKIMNSHLAKDSTISSLHSKIQEFYDKNGAAHRRWGSQLKQMLEETASGAKLTHAEVQQISTAFENVVSSARQAGKLGKSFFQTLREGMSSFGYWTSATFVVMKVIQSIKSGISTVRKLDTALVDLKKTTTMNSNELEKFYYDSNKVAKQMGVTTEEIINQASAWSRLGFSSGETATKMAQLSSKFASISPGMSTDQAQEGLVSIIKAWGLDVDEVEREVMDNINTLGNKFAESNLDLVNGMKRSAAALAATGTTYQDAFALFTGAQEVVQNAEVTGRALRSISMRIHGYSEDSEDGLMELDEELKNITGDLIDLTKTAEHSQGVSIFKEGSSTEFKSLVEYFGQINEIWGEMSQSQQNDFLDKAFGKNQAQAGAAIIQNYEAITASIEAMNNAAGSSDREMSIVMDSLDFKLNRLSETGTSVAQNLFKKDDMKTIVDSLTLIVEVVDLLTSKIGLLGSIGAGVGIFAGFKNVGKPKMYGFDYCLNMPTVC